METRSAHPRVEEKEEAPSWGLEPCLCEFQAAESGLHSAGKAAVLQPKIHNILGRMYLFCFVLFFLFSSLPICGFHKGSDLYLVQNCIFSIITVPEITAIEYMGEQYTEEMLLDK